VHESIFPRIAAAKGGMGYPPDDVSRYGEIKDIKASSNEKRV